MVAPSASSPPDPVNFPAGKKESNRSAEGWLRRLDEIEGADLPIVGGKSYRLALLKRYGLPVPPGLVLTTHAFKSQLRHNKLIPLWAGSPDVAVTAESLAWLADTIKTIPLAPPLLDHLNRQLEETFGPEVDSFAVRSSVIDEDQRDKTFAGIHLTELGVPRSAIPIAISRCWASALSEPAIQYRQRHDMSVQAIEIAVLIQPLLSPLCAGVGFTLNPLTGAAGEIVIEAVWGLGAALVSGAVQPHFYRVARKPPHYPLIEQKSGSSSPPAESGQSATGPLSDALRTQLAYQLQQIEALMGAPQDVEWALQDETLFVLQTRPVALPAAATSPDQAWTRGAYRESLPEIPSPFFGALLERSQPHLQQYFQALGFASQGAGPFETLILGRPYVNITFLKQLAGQVGLSLDGVLQAIGYIDASRAANPFAIDWGTAWRSRHIYRAVYQQIEQAADRLAQTEKLIQTVTQAWLTREPTAPPADQLLNQLHQQDEVYQALARLTLQLDLGIALVTTIGGHLIATQTEQPGVALFKLAMQDFTSSRSRLQQALAALGRMAQADEALGAYLRHAPEDFADYDQAAADWPEFRRGFGALLAQYGEWATYEADPAWPRYREAPAALLNAVRQYARQEAWLSPDRLAGQESWPNLSWRGPLVRPLVSRLRRLLGWRDQAMWLRVRSVAAARQWGLTLGRQWGARGWLAQADDIFWLTSGDIERVLLTGETVGVTMPATVRSRQETHESYAKTIVPYTLHESQLSAIQLGLEGTAAPAADVTIGLPVSPGQTRGAALVIRHPHDPIPAADALILVMPSTGPEWLPLLHRAAGLIVETGGLLSHGSVIAREYGLPAVANIPQATQRFQNGDQLLVDGSTGVVQLLARAQSNFDGVYTTNWPS